MLWKEIIIEINTRDVETASAVANMAVDYGIYIEDYSDIVEQSWDIAHVDLIDEELLARDREKAFIHIYVDETVNVSEASAFLKERLSAAGVENRVSSKSVENTDWFEGWKKFFKPITAGEKLAVVPSWEKYPDDGRVQMRIDPGAAFGTGTHATTSLCLSMSEKLITEDTTVLDIGCGSGILGIAAVLLGAKNSVGIDIDPVAVKVARENAELNSVSDKTVFDVGDLTEKVTGRFSLIYANIVADVIIRLLPDLRDYMADGAFAVLSGIIDMRAEDIRKAISDNGFTVVSECTEDNWYAFIIC